MSLNNILFLDNDGVCNTIENVLLKKNNKQVSIDGIKQDYAYYDPKLIRNIEKLVNKYNLKVVSSSSWRLDYSASYLQTLYQYMGVTIPVIDIITCNDLGTKDNRRSYQIQDWLLKNKCKNYLVLDDNNEAGVHHFNNFFKVDSLIGFNDEALIKAIKMCDQIFK